MIDADIIGSIANAITVLLAGIVLMMSKQSAPTHKHVIEQNHALTST